MILLKSLFSRVSLLASDFSIYWCDQYSLLPTVTQHSSNLNQTIDLPSSSLSQHSRYGPVSFSQLFVLTNIQFTIKKWKGIEETPWAEIVIMRNWIQRCNLEYMGILKHLLQRKAVDLGFWILRQCYSDGNLVLIVAVHSVLRCKAWSGPGWWVYAIAGNWQYLRGFYSLSSLPDVMEVIVFTFQLNLLPQRNLWALGSGVQPNKEMGASSFHQTQLLMKSRCWTDAGGAEW